MCTLSRTKVLKKKVENNKTHRSQMRTVISNGKYLLKSVIDHGNKYMSTKTPCRRMWASILGSIFCMTVSKKKCLFQKNLSTIIVSKQWLVQKKLIIYFLPKKWLFVPSENSANIVELWALFILYNCNKDDASAAMILANPSNAW